MESGRYRKMKRYLEDDAYKRISQDFEFLFKAIRDSRGELDFRLRDGYFNIYYKGNSLAKVTIRTPDYLVSIHHKFAIEEILQENDRFKGIGKKRNDYFEYQLSSELLHPFFQKKHLDRLGSNIAKVNYGEEIAFEQILITDNMERDDLFIIDRQVTETAMKGRKVDLLVLRQKQVNQFNFLVIEVKLGNNPELRGEVGDQISSYVDHIKDHFIDWKVSYEQTYRQLKGLGLFDRPEFEEVEIVRGTEGMVVVGGYSGIAAIVIAGLRELHPTINVKQLMNLL